MLVKTFGSAVYGVDAVTITIETSVEQGMYTYIVGLPDSAVKESQHRVETAIKHLDYKMPRQKIVINLAPADIRKEGSAYDLPIALGILAGSNQIENLEKLGEYIIMGELSLDGSLQPIKGALPIAIQARKEKFKGIILPKQNAREAAIVNSLEVYGVENLTDVVRFFNDENNLTQTVVDTREEFADNLQKSEYDFSDV
ncbi:MAG TPA: magnesium chelatase domain-containing protein, partial [Chitinophagales bacterium]